MTAVLAKTKRARGREKQAKIKPVITARNDMPVKISTVATKWAVVGLRVHVAIADRRQRLDREVEVGERSVLRGIGDRLMAEGIEEAENGVERDKYRGGRAKKHRPVHCHRAMIEIAPKALAPAKRLDLPVTQPDELRLFL